MRTRVLIQGFSGSLDTLNSFQNDLKMKSEPLSMNSLTKDEGNATFGLGRAQKALK